MHSVGSERLRTAGVIRSLRMWIQVPPFLFEQCLKMDFSLIVMSEGGQPAALRQHDWIQCG